MSQGHTESRMLSSHLHYEPCHVTVGFLFRDVLVPEVFPASHQILWKAAGADRLELRDDPVDACFPERERITRFRAATAFLLDEVSVRRADRAAPDIQNLRLRAKAPTTV